MFLAENPFMWPSFYQYTRTGKLQGLSVAPVAGLAGLGASGLSDVGFVSDRNVRPPLLACPTWALCRTKWPISLWRTCGHHYLVTANV